MTRPTTSAASNRTGPATRETASSLRWSAPRASRSTCGTTSPTKEIGPTAAVDAPHSRVIEVSASARARLGLTPSALACSSPSAKALSVSPEARASTSPTTRKGATHTSSTASRSASEPRTQKR